MSNREETLTEAKNLKALSRRYSDIAALDRLAAVAAERACDLSEAELLYDSEREWLEMAYEAEQEFTVLKASLRSTVRAIDAATAQQASNVYYLRQAGATWSEIAVELGVTKQAALKRFGTKNKTTTIAGDMPPALEGMDV